MMQSIFSKFRLSCRKGNNLIIEIVGNTIHNGIIELNSK